MSSPQTDECPWCDYAGPDGQPHSTYKAHLTADGIQIAAWVRCPECGCQGPIALLTFDKGWDPKKRKTDAQVAQEKAWELWRKRKDQTP